MAGADSVTLSAPTHELDGTPLVEADILAEIHRVSGLDAREIPKETGCREDVQRSLASTLAINGPEEVIEWVEAAADVGTFDAERAERAQAGGACAASRSEPSLTRYDARLSEETRRALFHPTDSESYSPTALETYAACGFKFYMKTVIGIEEDDSLTAEASPLQKGSFVHAVVERFYLEQQDSLGEPVDEIISDTKYWQNQLLQIALAELDETLTREPTPFQRAWLEAVFAGLGDEASNPYYGNRRPDEPEIGVLCRFLREEELLSNTTVTPTWFEARFGRRREFDTTVLQEEPVQLETQNGRIPISGTVDRIDTYRDEDGLHLVVRDYKTGNTPNEAATLDGLRFQLPLYAHMAESVLEKGDDADISTVGGSYYQLKPPLEVNHYKGQIGSKEHTAHMRKGGGAAMLAWKYPRFETHAEFRTFIDEEIVSRIGRITAAIEKGAFHPTILDPNDAGCRYCAYQSVCDVRPHQRHETIEELETSESPSYIPEMARGIHYEASDTEGGA
ncbi:PD-(D/E)XK nuclease family protein [Haladaptatus sp. GCM10025707]